MSNVAIFKAGKTPQYLTSINTPDYSADPDVLVNPDISKVKDVPLEHWKRDRDKIVEMSLAEKQVIIDAKLLEIDKQIIDLNIDALIVAKAIAKVLIAKGIITKTDLVNAIKGL